MTDQTIDVTGGGREHTITRYITELTGRDITADQVLVALRRDETTPAQWVQPDLVTTGTITAGDYARRHQIGLDIDPTTPLHWVGVELLLGADRIPPPGDYALWTNTGDGDARIIRRSPGRITIT